VIVFFPTVKSKTDPLSLVLDRGIFDQKSFRERVLTSLALRAPTGAAELYALRRDKVIFPPVREEMTP